MKARMDTATCPPPQPSRPAMMSCHGPSNLRSWNAARATGEVPLRLFLILSLLLVPSPLAVSSLTMSALSSRNSSGQQQRMSEESTSRTSSSSFVETTWGTSPDSAADDPVLTCDYLVVGAGAMGLAFVDSLLLLQPNATVVLVDKHPAPGGHWNDDYDYVKLHQPSLVYGVESSQLEGNWLASLLLRRQIPFTHRATKLEILQYYKEVVDTYVASGQLQYFPYGSYDLDQAPETVGDGIEIHSFNTNSPHAPSCGGNDVEKASCAATTTRHRVQVKVLMVDAVQGEVKIPATTPPAFAVKDASLRIVTPNELHQMHQTNGREQGSATATSSWFSIGWNYVSLWLRRAGNWIATSSSSTAGADSSQGRSDGSTGPTQYVVLGCGKTGMDAVVYLRTELKVPAERIVWVISRDVWIINRGRGGPGQYHQELLEQAGDHEATMDALEAKNIVYRLDSDVRPTAPFRFPTVSTDEIKELRSIGNKVRRGRVSSISVADDQYPRLAFEDGTDLVLTNGTVRDTVFVHCTSPGPFNGRQIDSIYADNGKRMTLYPLLPPPIPLSGAMLARIETSRRNRTVDFSLGHAILSAENGNPNNTARTSGDSVWRQLIRPYYVGSTDVNGQMAVHWNLATFLALLDKNPAVGADWLSKGNRLSIYSWIQKLHSYENVMLMIDQASSLGFSSGDVRTLELMAKKLEPLRGR